MEPNEKLANAIILRATDDYRMADDERELREIESFFCSGWVGVLSKINPEYLIRQLRKEKNHDG